MKTPSSDDITAAKVEGVGHLGTILSDTAIGHGWTPWRLR